MQQQRDISLGNEKPRTCARGFLGMWAILDYLASLGGHMGEAFTTQGTPADKVRLVCFGSARSIKLDAGANKKPRTCARGFLGLWAILDYLASLGGHMGEAFTTQGGPADEVRLVCFGSARSIELDA